MRALMDADEILSSAAQTRFASAVITFQGTCLWWRQSDAPVTTRAEAADIIRHLREQGGRAGWKAAAELTRLR
jgi:hypothetical protein